MSEAEQGRSEQPTPHKLAKAREKGTVARGMDLGYLTALATFSGYAAIAGPGLIIALSRAVAQTLAVAPHLLRTPHALAAVSRHLFGAILGPVALLCGLILAVVLVFELLQTGFVFSTEPLSLDFGRLNPAKGFKRVFSRRLLIETAKNVLKLAVYAALAWVVLRRLAQTEAPAITDATQLAEALRATALRLLALFCAAAAGFAILDQIIVRREFLSNMRMSRREIRRETREREGEPRLKQRRKQLHREFVKASQSLRGIREADVLITNPTHFAVALKYDPATMSAPLVVAQGSHQFALRLRRMAFTYGVTIVENRDLARALHACALNRPIPDPLFRAVADIYLSIRARKRAQEPLVDA